MNTAAAIKCRKRLTKLYLRTATTEKKDAVSLEQPKRHNGMGSYGSVVTYAELGRRTHKIYAASLHLCLTPCRALCDIELRHIGEKQEPAATDLHHGVLAIGKPLNHQGTLPS